MKSTDDFEHLRKILVALRPKFQDWKVSRIRVFGSFATGHVTPDSDIDMILDFEEKPGLLGFVGIKQDLEDTLHRKVDLFTEESISRYIRKKVLEEARDV